MRGWGKSVRVIIAALAALGIAALACGPTVQPTTSDTAVDTSSAPTATATAGPVVSADVTPSLTYAPVCTPPPCLPGEVYYCAGECPGGCGTTCATVTPGATTLSAGGPWMVFRVQREDRIGDLWAVNADGTGLTRLVQDEMIVFPYIESISVSPRGGYVAFETATDDQLHNLTLNLIALPSGLREVITPLTNAATAPEPSEPPVLPANFDIVRAMTEVDHLAWSPDGTRLAFMGAMLDSTSSDLYTYDVRSGAMVHLSDGPSQAIMPAWSPDGRYIVHFGVSTMGTGAGLGMEGAWAADVQTGEIITLFAPDSAFEQVLGWIGDNTVLIASAYNDCGFRRIASYRLSDNQPALVVERCFTDAAYNPAANEILIVSGDFTSYDPDGLPGAFLATPGDMGATPISDQPATDVEFSPALNTYFLRLENRVEALTLVGEGYATPDLNTGPPVISPDGQYWAWIGAGYADVRGLWIGPVGDPNPVQVSTETVHEALWSPDGQSLMFFTVTALYRIDMSDPGLTPQLILSGLESWNAAGAAWVQP